MAEARNRFGEEARFKSGRIVIVQYGKSAATSLYARRAAGKGTVHFDCFRMCRSPVTAARERSDPGFCFQAIR